MTRFIKTFFISMILLWLVPLTTFSQDNSAEYSKTIEMADSYFSRGDYINAKASYQIAVRLAPNEQYPKDRLQQSLDMIKVQMYQNSLYTQKIQVADELFNKQDFDNALKYYQEALTILPGDVYASGKIQEINRNKMDTKQVEENYLKNITAGDKFFKENKLDQALTEYQSAAALKPSEAYPKEQVNRIQTLISEKKQVADEFQAAMRDAELAITRNKYDEAITLLEKAIHLVPNDPLPKQKLAEAQNLKAAWESYSSIITTADDYYVNKDFLQAKAKYLQAQSIKPEDEYPRRMLEKIDIAMMDIEQANRSSYEFTIEKADALFDQQDYEKAMVEYNNALRFKPDADYAKQRINDINNALSLRKTQEEAYTQAIARADLLFREEKFEEARKEYSNAITIKPLEQYPKVKVEEINTRLADLATKREQYNNLIKGADKLFFSDEYVEAREQYREASYMFPEEKYPINQITMINEILGTRDKYVKAVTRADQLLYEKDYEAALMEFRNAAALDPNEEYPVKKIRELEALVAAEAKKQQELEAKRIFEMKQDSAEQAQTMAVEQQYQGLIAGADLAMQQKDYQGALTGYQEARKIKPGEVYAEGKIGQINKILKEIETKKAAEEAARIAAAEEAARIAAAEEAAKIAAAEEAAKKAAADEAAKIAAAEEAARIAAAEEAAKIAAAEEVAKKVAAEEAARIAAAEEAAKKAAAEEAAKIAAAEEAARIAAAEEAARIAAAEEAAKIAAAEEAAKKAAADEAAKIAAAEEAARIAAAEEAAKIAAAEEAARIAAAEEEARIIAAEEAARIAAAEEAAKIAAAEEAARIAAAEEAAKKAAAEEAAKKEAARIAAEEEAARIAAAEEAAKKAAAEEAARIAAAEEAAKKAAAEEAAKIAAAEEAARKAAAEEAARIAAAEEAAKKAIDKQYADAITVADRDLMLKEYQKALTGYQSASSLKPEEEYPKRKINEVNNTLAEIAKQEELNKKYSQVIASANSFFDQAKYEDARAAYQEATTLKPSEELPRKQIIEIDRRLQNMVAERDQAYQVAITKADGFLSLKDYEMAKIHYSRALELKPGESYPSEKLNEVNLEITKKRQLLQEEYDRIIVEADKFFTAKTYDNALESYRSASLIKPGEAYPKEMAGRILKLLGERSIVQINKELLLIPSNTTHKFEFMPVPAKDRKSNYIFFKARNVANHDFKLIISFGQDQAKNGGVVVKVPAGENVYDYIVRISAQYKWFSDDNNWISFYPEGGDIEVYLVQVSYSD
jgi:tetratricopeptide (TPR) repeat protein